MKIQFTGKIKPKFRLAHTRPGRRLGQFTRRHGFGSWGRMRPGTKARRIEFVACFPPTSPTARLWLKLDCQSLDFDWLLESRK